MINMWLYGFNHCLFCDEIFQLNQKIVYQNGMHCNEVEAPRVNLT